MPQVVSVTGYNDSELASAFEPPITSVDTPLEIHAQEVAKAMLAALREDQLFPFIRLPTYLRVRNSTGPIAAKDA